MGPRAAALFRQGFALDRQITYVGSSLYEWHLSKPDQNAMVGLAKFAAAVLGTSGAVNGLACVPTGPASLQVVIQPGEIYQLASLEATVCGTLPVDTTHQVLKQGIQLDAVTLPTMAAPGTVGQSINYLIEASYSDQDVSVDPTTGNPNIVLQFFNSASPSTPFTGPNNTGVSSNTYRKGVVTLTVKAGAAATTGTQVTPTPDAGAIGLWVVTVANGQATVIAGNISAYPGAPFIIPNGGRALGNFSSATQLAPGATTNLTQSQAGIYFQAQGGTVNLPAATGMQPGQSFIISASASTVINPNGTDKIFLGGTQFPSVTLGNADFIVLTFLANFGGINTWEASSGSTMLGYTAAFGNSLAVNGWRQLPSGDIEQWGTVTSTGTFSGAFPKAFTTAVYNIVVTDNTSARNSFGAADTDLGHFQIFGPAGAWTACWRAIGK